ncbi:uncharacterized protein MYCFIDRAFT_75475 [Pseudocercospora fijiensis CIRAD86]|uniref:Roadblock/LAMTOR2 domain-containing protein n=1 Tax=Pseudocercospora fijiensis (strain CIRAD86) TaxID=383855 RepID=N1Q9Q9_PSEFD|nr:uncharacterized protein MYCFIDRAFT_75475 [Pseudocercospora fijiensis CIRAD86]EME87627.1 hypothetical protein MYCFIDRAFT_75475 [Pseudocercospora fijiensis CIRAD86]
MPRIARALVNPPCLLALMCLSETENLLARLSHRPGVQGTLILSRDTGAIVRSSGLVTDEDVEEEESSRPQSSGGGQGQINGIDGQAKKRGTRKADEVASLVFKFVQSTGAMIEELNGESDEAKLLRVRTKKNEMVIVPESQNVVRSKDSFDLLSMRA